MLTFVYVDALSVPDAVSDIQPMEIVTLDVRQTAVKLQCVGGDSCGSVHDTLKLVCASASRRLQ